MATDVTLLQDGAQTILDALVDGAADADWVPENACITAGEPAPRCDGVYVWVDQINPLHEPTGSARCQVAIEVRYRYAVTVCISGDLDEDCDFWDAISPGHHEKVWAAFVGVVDAWAAGTLCGAACYQVRLSPLEQLSTQGTMAIWRGSVTAIVSPVTTP